MTMTRKNKNEAEVWHIQNSTLIKKNGEIVGVEMIVDAEPIKSRRKASSL